MRGVDSGDNRRRAAGDNNHDKRLKRGVLKEGREEMER